MYLRNFVACTDDPATLWHGRSATVDQVLRVVSLLQVLFNLVSLRCDKALAPIEITVLVPTDVVVITKGYKIKEYLKQRHNAQYLAHSCRSAEPERSWVIHTGNEVHART